MVLRFFSGRLAHESRRVAPCWAISALLLAMVGRVGADERGAFLDAERALQAGDLETFERMASRRRRTPR